MTRQSYSKVAYLTLFNGVFIKTPSVDLWNIYNYSVEWCSVRPVWETLARPVLFIPSSIPESPEWCRTYTRPALCPLLVKQSWVMSRAHYCVYGKGSLLNWVSLTSSQAENLRLRPVPNDTQASNDLLCQCTEPWCIREKSQRSDVSEKEVFSGVISDHQATSKF